jgi:hypothetical protein
VYIIAGVIGASGGAVGAAIYTHFRRRNFAAIIPPELTAERRIDLNKIFTEKPYLRDDDKEAIKYIVEKGGVAYETEIRDKFNLPKTTIWRLVRRLERDGIVEVKKTGGQNLIRIKEDFVKKDNGSNQTRVGL